MSVHDGGPAFPSVDIDDDGNKVAWSQERGMTLRDYFAAAAISGLIQRHRADVAWADVAPAAYKIADAMIAHREAK
jgi:hypothetical protein